MQNNVELKMNDRVFFNPGDLVTLKKDVDSKPSKMLVSTVDKIRRGSQEVDKDRLLGITCVWFTSGGEVQKFRFDSKDLKHTE